ncbi:MAG: cytochrome c oxidase subunit 3, partial [Woeseiaceae bacterium]
LRQEVDSGQHYLPGLVTGTRETIVTSPRSARPEYVLRLPGPSWLPFMAGVGTAAFFFCLTLKWFVAAALGAALTLASILKWLWDSDPAPGALLHDIGDGIRVPDAMTGSRSHAWWAMVVVLLVDAAILASLLFSGFFLAGQAPEWPPAGWLAPSMGASAISALAWFLCGAAIEYASRALRACRTSAFAGAVFCGIVLAAGAVALMSQALSASNIRPEPHAFGAMTHAFLYWQALHVVLAVIMATYVLARLWSGKIDARRRATFDHARLLWHYMSAQALVILAVQQL